MSEFKKYVDIERLKASYAEAFDIGEEITISEKVDGSNASFTYNSASDEVVAFSRRKSLDEVNTLQGFWEYTQKFDKNDIAQITQGGRYVLFGEWLVKNKIQYPAERYKKFYLFDVWDNQTGQYLEWDKVEGFFKALAVSYEIYIAPIFYIGPFKGWEHAQSFVGQTELGATPCGEGVVIKSQDRLSDKDNSRRPRYLKLVSEHFTEVQKTKAPIDPEVLKEREAMRALAATIVTKRRTEKMLAALRDDGIIPEDWGSESMGIISKNITKRMYADCVKEEPETVEMVPNFGKICASLTMEHVRSILKEREDI